nr:MAG TPA: hypothetical protein [Caudoviricetes sp.]
MSTTLSCQRNKYITILIKSKTFNKLIRHTRANCLTNQIV